jgi:hypothetical protein
MRQLKLNRAEKMLFVIPLILILISTLLLHKWHEWTLPVDEKLDKEASSQAGPDAIDCGFVEDTKALDQRAVVDACVVSAFRAKRPFKARFQKKLPYNQIETYWIFGTVKGDICSMRRSGSVTDLSGTSRNPKIVMINGRERLVCPENPE